MKIWIDFCHIPNVPFFLPQIQELNRLGHVTIITVRKRYQIFDLCDTAGLKYYKIGRHYGKRTIMKGLGLFIRTMQLYNFAHKQNFDIAVSHGSPHQILAAFLLGIPSLDFEDYEHFAFHKIFFKIATRIAVPEVIPVEVLGTKGTDCHKVFKYPGLKEDVYCEKFQPNPAILGELNIDPNKIIVTLRPPAIQAHYHNPQSEELFSAAISYLSDQPDVTIVILPRTMKEKEKNQERYNCKDGKIIMPARTINGLNLIWHSDLVISGGGTMNREAAALGVPVYSIFRGPIGAVDRFLARTGKLIFIETVSDIQKIKIEKRNRENLRFQHRQKLTSFLIEKIYPLGNKT